jgi:hypothetical protein
MMGVAIGHLRPQPRPARVWTGRIWFRTGSQYRRTAAALLTMMILTVSAIMGGSAFRHVAPAGQLPQPSGYAQPAPVPDR